MKKILWVLGLCLLTLHATAAQDRAGVDRPIRVGMLKGTGSGSRYWHTNIHTAHTVISTILANPAGANLGPELSVPLKGFSFYVTPLPQASAGGECTGNGCGPTPAEITAFVAALDTLDVIILNSVVDAGSRVTDAGQRNAFLNFWTRKGYVAIHWTLDSFGTWPFLDSIHGARFRNQPSEQVGTVRRDSVFQQEAAWQYLNRGLFSNGLDTAFREEWMYFTTSGATIRAQAHLRPTLNLDESSILFPGSATPMGDHPMSWYRHLPTGGRFFFTALGHRSQVWQDTRTFRRQLYNAILWTAKYDSTSQVVSTHPADAGVSFDRTRLSFTASTLRVSILEEGPHVVEVRRLDGTLAGSRRGSGREEHLFAGLRGVHAVSVRTAGGRLLRRVSIP